PARVESFAEDAALDWLSQSVPATNRAPPAPGFPGAELSEAELLDWFARTTPGLDGQGAVEAPAMAEQPTTPVIQDEQPAHDTEIVATEGGPSGAVQPAKRRRSRKKKTAPSAPQMS